MIGYILGLLTCAALYIYYRRKTNAGSPYGPGGKPWWLWGA